MTTRRSARKKPNSFEVLSETIDENQESDFIDSSSVTLDCDQTDTNAVSELKQDFTTFQSETKSQIDNIEYSICQLTDSMTAITESISAINSRILKTSGVNNTTTTTNNDADEDDNDMNPEEHSAFHSAPTPKTSSGHFTTPQGTTNPTYTNQIAAPISTPHRFWKIVREDNLEAHHFQSHIKGITLQDDTMHGLRLFYNKIRHAMHTSFKKHIDILPPFGKLSTINSITQLLVPSNTNYAGYPMIKSVYDWFSTSITNILFDQDVINKKRTPKAFHVISSHNHNEDGWDLLFILLSKRCPFLGGTSIDVATEITMLKIHSNDDIHTFYQHVQSLSTKLRYSNETVDKTCLLKLYLKAMSVSKVHFPLLQLFIADLNAHITTYGANSKHPTLTCTYVYDYLVSIEAPEKFELSYAFHHTPTNQTSKSHFRKSHKPRSHKPNISAMEQVEELLHSNSFDSHKVPPQDTFIPESDLDDIPDKYAPFIAAFRRSSHIICDACGSKGHHASKCYKRGLEFLPRDIQRRVTVYNAKYGSTPTDDTSLNPHKSYHTLAPPDHRPPSPAHQSSQLNPTDDAVNDQPATISSLSHVLPTEDVEEILDTELSNPITPTISMMEHPSPDNIILSRLGNYISSIINMLNDEDSSRSPKVDLQFCLHDSSRTALYRLEDTTHLHVSNNENDFAQICTHRSTIQLPNGLSFSCEGIGTIFTRIKSSKQSIVITPAYFCPQATVGILSIPALITRNPSFIISIEHRTSITIQDINITTSAIIPIIMHDESEYISIPVLDLCTNDSYYLPGVPICHDRDDDSDIPVLASIATTTLTYDPFQHPIINDKGQVNIGNFTELQRTVLDSYPHTFFCQHRTAIFHLDSGANVHATNNRNDFIIFHEIKTDIHLAVGSKAQ